MFNAMMLGAALFTAQAEAPQPPDLLPVPPAVEELKPAAPKTLEDILKTPVKPAGVTVTLDPFSGVDAKDAKDKKDDGKKETGMPGGTVIDAPSGDCAAPAPRRCRGGCNVQWLRPWTCSAEPAVEVRPRARANNLYRLVYRGPSAAAPVMAKKLPTFEVKDGEIVQVSASETTGEAADVIVDGGAAYVEGDCTPAPLMQWLNCRLPGLACRMDKSGIEAYGFVQQGYTINTDSPRDRHNYGVNFNNRSNDYLLNQAYIVLEKPLDLCRRNELHFGGRLDFFAGHDAPDVENNALGLWDNVSGNRQRRARTSEFGFSTPQFYIDAHLPILGERGTDVRVGRFYSLMSGEEVMGTNTDFYSHSYEFFYGLPFTHTGIMVTNYLGERISVHNALVRGWEVNFQDNNDVWAYKGGLTLHNCNRRSALSLSWYHGPEQNGNGPFALTNPSANGNYRTVAAAYYTRMFGCRDQLRWVVGGHLGYEDNATINPFTGATQNAEWYGATSSLFYTVSQTLQLGVRGEIFRDDDGTRTAHLNVPGFAGNVYEVTLGATYRPFQNLRLRPEVRFDWAGDTRLPGVLPLRVSPYNDQRDTFQTTLGIDAIWDF
jgi:hypothetical protein